MKQQFSNNPQFKDYRPQDYGQPGNYSEPGSEEDRNLLDRELEEGEQILWFDRPHPAFWPSRPRSRASTFIDAGLSIICVGLGIIVILFGGISLIFLSSDIGTREFAPSLFGSGAFCILIPICSKLISKLIARNRANIFRSFLFAITDRRAIIIRQGPSLTARSYFSNDIGPITCVERPDGSGNLFFAHSRGSSYAYNPAYNNTNPFPYYPRYNSQAVGFEAIPNVREVERLLRRTFKREF